MPRRRVFRSFTAVATGAAMIALATRRHAASDDASAGITGVRVPAHRRPKRAGPPRDDAQG